MAADRRELFVGTGIQTPANGLRLLPEHRSTVTIMEFDPVRDADGTLRIDHQLPDSVEGRAAAQLGLRDGSTSSHFRPSSSHFQSKPPLLRARGARILVVTAVALVGSGSYGQARAEVRSKRSARYGSNG